MNLLSYVNRPLFPIPRKALVLLAEVAAECNVTVRDIQRRCREVPLVRARHFAMYRLAKETRWSLHQMARVFDRDHSTILYGVRAHAERNGLPPARERRR